MAIISGGNVIEGAGLGTPLTNAGAPAAGTDEVQTLAIGGTPTGGTFQLAFSGHTTDDITWSATDATLVANIQAALDALPNVGEDGIAVADSTLTSGIGNATLTFSGANLAKTAQPLVTVADNSLTGTSPTLAVTETTPGVTATSRNAAAGALLVDTTNKLLYINTGSAGAPTWTKVGLQS